MDGCLEVKQENLAIIESAVLTLVNFWTTTYIAWSACLDMTACFCAACPRVKTGQAIKEPITKTAQQSQ